MGSYLVIDKRALPEVFEKVVEAKNLLKDGKVKEITEATKKVGISRSVYYKYKDFVFDFAEKQDGKKVTFFMMIKHQKGVLSEILNDISEQGGSILTIDQGIPINGLANLSLTIDISQLESDIKDMQHRLGNLVGVEKVEFIAME